MHNKQANIISKIIRLNKEILFIKSIKSKIPKKYLNYNKFIQRLFLA